jgi:hypothetical protein
VVGARSRVILGAKLGSLYLILRATGNQQSFRQREWAGLCCRELISAAERRQWLGRAEGRVGAVTGQGRERKTVNERKEAG